MLRKCISVFLSFFAPCHVHYPGQQNVANNEGLHEAKKTTKETAEMNWVTNLQKINTFWFRFFLDFAEEWIKIMSTHITINDYR